MPFNLHSLIANIVDEFAKLQLRDGANCAWGCWPHSNCGTNKYVHEGIFINCRAGNEISDKTEWFKEHWVSLGSDQTARDVLIRTIVMCFPRCLSRRDLLPAAHFEWTNCSVSSRVNKTWAFLVPSDIPSTWSWLQSLCPWLCERSPEVPCHWCNIWPATQNSPVPTWLLHLLSNLHAPPLGSCLSLSSLCL